MSVDAPELRNLMCRVERLEKQNRWLKRAGVGVLVAVGAVLLMGLAAPVPQTIREGRGVVRASSGMLRKISPYCKPGALLRD